MESGAGELEHTRGTSYPASALQPTYRPAIDTFRCRSMRRAAYEGRHKLITVGDQPDELFDLIDDPRETRSILAQYPDKADRLHEALVDFARRAEERRPANWESRRRVSMDNEEISERLRAPGYIE